MLVVLLIRICKCLYIYSMGGSVVVNVAHKRKFKNIIGVTVLDVVEGSAIDALSSMTKILNSRPKIFNSNEQAIQWRYVV